MRARRNVVAAGAMVEIEWLHYAAQDAIACGEDREACEAQALAATMEVARRAEPDCEGGAFTDLCARVERAVALFGQDLIADATGADLHRDFVERTTLSVFNGDALDVVALCMAENDISRAPVFEAALMREYSLGAASGEIFILRYLWQKLRMLPEHADTPPSFLARMCGHNPEGVDAQGRAVPARRSVPLPRLVEFLLNGRADRNAQGTQIDPPVHYLLKAPEWTPAHRDALVVLLDRGAFPDAKNAEGQDAFEIAREHGAALNPAEAHAEPRLRALRDAMARRKASSLVEQIAKLIAATDQPATERAKRLHALLGEAEALCAPFVLLSEAIRQHEVGALTALLAIDAFDPLATDLQGRDLLMATPAFFNAREVNRRSEPAAKQIVEILARAIGVDRRDELGQTALMHAADDGGRVFGWLLEHPQDLAAQDHEGHTALMRLAVANDKGLINRLIEKDSVRADIASGPEIEGAAGAANAANPAHAPNAVDVVDAQGQTALQLAIGAHAVDAAERLAPATHVRLDEALAACAEQASVAFLGRAAPWAKDFALLADSLAARCTESASRAALARLGAERMPQTARRLDALDIERGVAEGRAAAAQAASKSDPPAVEAVESVGVVAVRRARRV